MFCNFLKWFLREATEVTLVMAILVTPASAQDFTPEQTLLCNAKQTVVEYVYTHRNVKPKSHMFESLDYTWDLRWTSLHYATYVDLRRIINEAYRINAGEYRRLACIAGDTTSNSEGCKALILERVTKECREALRYDY